MTEIPQEAALARQLYADGHSVADILTETQLTHDRLYYWLDGGPGLLPPLPRRRSFSRGIAIASERIALIGRMMRAAERQVHEIERRSAANVSWPSGIALLSRPRAYSFMNSLNVLYIFGNSVM